MINILALLHIALSLLTNPQVQANPTLLAQANSFAIEAVQLAEQSLTTANSTSTDATTTIVTPIVIPSVPVVTSTPVTTNTPTNQPALGAVPTVVAPLAGVGLYLSADHETSSSISLYTDGGNAVAQAIIGDNIAVTISCDLVNSPNCSSAPQTLDLTNATSSQSEVTFTGLMPNTYYLFTQTVSNSAGTATSTGLGDKTNP